MKRADCRRARRDIALETYQCVDQEAVSFKDHWAAFNVEHQKAKKDALAEASKARKQARKATR